MPNKKPNKPQPAPRPGSESGAKPQPGAVTKPGSGHPPSKGVIKPQDNDQPPQKNKISGNALTAGLMVSCFDALSGIPRPV